MSNSSLFCSACSNVHEGIFFQCTVCLVFFVHQDCASRGYVILHKSHPGHPLRLGFCSSAIESINDCDICYVRIIDKSGWFYYCEECKFYAHLNCITSSENDQEVQEIGREIPCLPWEETHNEFGTVGLLTRNLKSIQNYEGSEVVMISHFSHPQHPLVLQTDVPKEANPYSDGEIIIVTTQCNGCTKQISAPLYSCISCHFYIHKGCALLPSSIPQHHSHSNDGHYCRLVLLREPWSETQVFECKICWNYCNGFCYQCEEESCGYTFDVECASLPITIVHKAHPFHPLQLVKFREFGWKRWAQSDNRVKCCLEKRNVDIYVYVCDICGIMIHATCAMYPGKAHHRFDCGSPFTLNYDSSLIEPNAFHYCDICEEILDPKKWFYFSPKNGFQVIHPWCIFLIYRAAVERPNFKSISSLFEFDIHPHILHLYAANHFSKCYHCKIAMAYHKKTEVQGPCSLSYQCGDCIYELHITCANKLFLPAKEDVEETADKGISTIAGNIQKLYLEGSDSTGVGGNPDTVSSTSKGKEILDHQSSSNDYAAVLQKLFFEEIGSTGLEEDPDDATTSKGK
ncbi:hypothetical protein Leryth_022445 [Lithospermum erythrorhizon]|nr:hypothetical protein Leryth_022445 [Lithospermum erythrorhizon]